MIFSSKQIIIKPDIFGNIYGGNAYEKQVVDILDFKFDLKWFNILSAKGLIKKLFKLIIVYFKCKTASDKILFLNYLTIPFYPILHKKNKTVLLIHHIDWSKSNFLSSLYQQICYKILLLKKDRFSSIVVVSRYWENYLLSLGFSNIHVIYNSINPNLSNNISLSKLDFIKKYNLNIDSYIYLGNAQKGKGWYNAYSELKNCNYNFLISGNIDNHHKLPENVFYVNPPYVDYLAMLKYADCSILLSNFNEGWNRTAHESILMGTPVIGNSAGGMSELLLNANQLICDNTKDLPNMVKEANLHRDSLKYNGFNYIKKFDLIYFSLEWNNLFHKLNF